MTWASDVVSHPLFNARGNDYLRWYPKTLTPTRTGSYPVVFRLAYPGRVYSCSLL